MLGKTILSLGFATRGRLFLSAWVKPIGLTWKGGAGVWLVQGSRWT